MENNALMITDGIKESGKNFVNGKFFQGKVRVVSAVIIMMSLRS